MTKIEFAIHLVQFDNQGQSLESLNNKTLMIVAKTFGGFTVTEGRGGWVNESGRLFDEPILRVTIACENTPENSGKLKQIAINYKEAASQEAVYIRGYNNQVTFV